jgi:uncharacterized Tic20 family protein
VFLLMLGFFNLLGFAIMVIVKMIGALIVWKIVK